MPVRIVQDVEQRERFFADLATLLGMVVQIAVRVEQTEGFESPLLEATLQFAGFGPFGFDDSRLCGGQAGLRPQQHQPAERQQRDCGGADQAGHRELWMPACPFLELLDAAQLRSVSQRTIFEPAVEVFGQFGSVLIARRGIGLQAFTDDAFETPRHVLSELPQRRN